MRVAAGIPLVYELNGEMKPIKHYYTASDAEVKAAIDKVANQGKAKWICDPTSPPPFVRPFFLRRNEIIFLYIFTFLFSFLCHLYLVCGGISLVPAWSRVICHTHHAAWLMYLRMGDYLGTTLTRNWAADHSKWAAQRRAFCDHYFLHFQLTPLFICRNSIYLYRCFNLFVTIYSLLFLIVKSCADFILLSEPAFPNDCMTVFCILFKCTCLLFLSVYLSYDVKINDVIYT